MSRRTAKFVSAIFASHLLAAAPLAPYRSGATEKPADNCLLRPEGRGAARAAIGITASTAPPSATAGTSATRREKFARAAPEDVAAGGQFRRAAAEKAATQRSIANARAEFPLPQTRVEPEPASPPRSGRRRRRRRSAPRTTSAHNAGDAGSRRSVVSPRAGPSRPSPASSAAAAAPPTAQSASPGRNATSAAPPPAAAACRRAGSPPAQHAVGRSTSGSVPMLLIVIVGALAVAGLMASAIVRRAANRAEAVANEIAAAGADLSRTASMPPLPDAAEQPRRRAAGIPRDRARRTIRTSGSRKCWRGWPAARRGLSVGYFSSCRCNSLTNSGQADLPLALEPLGRRIDCTSSKAIADIVVDDDVVVGVQVAEFVAGLLHAAADHLVGILRAGVQPFLQVGRRRRQDEHADDVAARACSRNCWVPCQSMSNSTSCPAASAASTGARGVP